MYFSLSLAVTTLLVAISVIIHYEALRALTRVMIGRHVHRRRLIGVVMGLLAAHTVEVWLFALAYSLLDNWTTFGSVMGASGNFEDYLYFSSVVYTTLGFGDQIPTGALRLVCGAEALTGLAMITWSASFMFVEMQRYWPGRDGTPPTI
jgi:hypothetical protein